MNDKSIELGAVYRDKVSGIVGIATQRSRYLNDKIGTVVLESKSPDGASRVTNEFSEIRLELFDDEDDGVFL